MRLSIDLDDVLADYNAATARVLNLQPDQLTPVWQNWVETIGEKNRDILFNISRNTNFMSSLLPFPGAKEGLIKLKEAGIQLFIISSRFNTMHSLTERWLEEHLPGTITEVRTLSGSKKNQACQELNVDWHIDDNPVHVRELMEDNIPVLVWDQPWNREIKESQFVKRVKNWDEVVKLIKN